MVSKAPRRLCRPKQRRRLVPAVVVVILVLALAWTTTAFSGLPAATRRDCSRLSSSNSNEQDLRQQARELLEQAQTLRKTLPNSNQDSDSIQSRLRSPWNIPENAVKEGVGYRLYLDIGREPGTWMDPLWGASGRRIEGSLDLHFATNQLATEDIEKQMVQDNWSGPRSEVQLVQTADAARLRGGFEQMKCYGGGYRLDQAASNNNPLAKSSTLRFFVTVEGTRSGDVSVPSGNLYFSLPAFGSVSQLSSKEGIVTVRQMGWNTGWRREESRIVGVFRAAPIEKARARDKF